MPNSTDSARHLFESLIFPIRLQAPGTRRTGGINAGSNLARRVSRWAAANRAQEGHLMYTCTYRVGRTVLMVHSALAHCAPVPGAPQSPPSHPQSPPVTPPPSHGRAEMGMPSSRCMSACVPCYMYNLALLTVVLDECVPSESSVFLLF